MPLGASLGLARRKGLLRPAASAANTEGSAVDSLVLNWSSYLVHDSMITAPDQKSTPNRVTFVTEEISILG